MRTGCVTVLVSDGTQISPNILSKEVQCDIQEQNENVVHLRQIEVCVKITDLESRPPPTGMVTSLHLMLVSALQHTHTALLHLSPLPTIHSYHGCVYITLSSGIYTSVTVINLGL